MEENSKIAHSTYMALKEDLCNIFYLLSEIKRISADMIEHRSRTLSEKEKEQISELIAKCTEPDADAEQCYRDLAKICGWEDEV